MTYKMTHFLHQKKAFKSFFHSYLQHNKNNVLSMVQALKNQELKLALHLDNYYTVIALKFELGAEC